MKMSLLQLSLSTLPKISCDGTEAISVEANKGEE
jgi:hypothetical protein